MSLTKLEVLHFTDDTVRELCEQVPAFRDSLNATVAARLRSSEA